MSPAVILVVGALQLQGNLKLSLDRAVYPKPDSGAELELYYDIPLTSLAFLRQGDSFAARFDIGVQLLDRSGSPLAGDMWQRTVLVPEYGTTVARDSNVSGMVSLSVPKAVNRCQVQITDRSSDRSAGAVFSLEPPSRLLVRLLRSGLPNPARTYRLGDTLEVLAELLMPDTRIDSFRFLVRDGRRVVTGATISTSPAGGQDHGQFPFPSARFLYPLADSVGAARLPGGEYGLDVTALGPAGQTHAARTDFRVLVPFFLDDKAFRQKVDELLYVATPAEMAELKRAPREEREQAWNDFWKKKDPTPTTARNEREEEYLARIEYAEEHFGGADKGFRSDRGRVYVRYGPPDNIESRPFELDVRASETWHYYSLGLEFVFVDRYGFGEYLLGNAEALNGH